MLLEKTSKVLDDHYPHFYLLTWNLSSIFGLIVSFFALYVIFVASPPFMKQYKYCQIGLQLTTIALDLDVELYMFEVYLPVLAMRMYGPLYTVFHLDLKWAFSLAYMSTFAMVGATCICSVYRHRQALPYDHWLNLSSNFWQRFIPIFFTLLIAVGVASVHCVTYQHPTDYPSMQEVIENYPAYAYLQYDVDVWMFNLEAPLAPPIFDFPAIRVLYVAIGSSMTLTFSMGCFFMTHTFVLLRGKNSHMSEKTRNMHRKLANALSWQVVVPAFTYMLPFLIYGLVLLYDKTIPQEWLNITTFLFTLHGKLASVLLILMTTPYRDFCMNPIQRLIKFKRHKTVTVTPSTHTSSNKVTKNG